MKKLNIVLLLALCFTLSGCYEKYSKAAKTHYLKMSPEEQGVMNLIGPAIGYVVYNIETAEESLEIWNRLKDKEGFVNEFRANYNKNLFLSSCKNLAKVLDYPIPQGQTLLVPESLDGVVRTMRSFLLLKGRINTKNPDVNDRDLLRDYAWEVRKADKRLASYWRGRSTNYANQKFSHNLTVEVDGLPFKVDFARGEVKVTHTRRLGPLRFSASTGPSGGEGVRTLIIQNSRYKRIYAVGGRTLELRVPESNLRVQDDVMTLTAIE